MYRQLTRFAHALAVFLILAWIAGCGGGGGGGSTSTADSYTGLTTQATITTTNGSEIATTSYTHGNSATTIGGVLGAPLTPGTPERGGPASKSPKPNLRLDTSPSSKTSTVTISARL